MSNKTGSNLTVNPCLSPDLRSKVLRVLSRATRPITRELCPQDFLPRDYKVLNLTNPSVGLMHKPTEGTTTF